MSETNQVNPVKTVQQVREDFLNTAKQLHQSYAKFISTLPLNPVLVQHAFQNLDQAAFWVDQAIRVMSFEVQSPTPEPSDLPTAESSNETKETVEQAAIEETTA